MVSAAPVTLSPTETQIFSNHISTEEKSLNIIYTHCYFKMMKFNLNIIFIYLFLVALGLCCCARASSSCSERGLLFVEVCGLLIVVASLVAEHGL